MFVNSLINTKHEFTANSDFKIKSKQITYVHYTNEYINTLIKCLLFIVYIIVMVNKYTKDLLYIYIHNVMVNIYTYTYRYINYWLQLATL